MLDNELKQQITKPLLQWFDVNKRILPWRDQPKAYYVWVSEIMLQQTRVEAVKSYFERFITDLPTIADLAVCPEDRLLKLWEGLGYYNRVRNMQAAAMDIIQRYHGEMPATKQELLTLKGIGSYTAGAIASIAFGEPVPAVDGNVLRVITRVCADHSDITKQSVKNEIEEDLNEIIPKDYAGEFNQALMELGALVCIPNGAPLCHQCPWNSFCRARITDQITSIPVKAPKKKKNLEQKTVLIIKDNDRILIRKRPSKGLLAGLYELPNLEGYLDETEVMNIVKNWGFSPIRILRVEDAKHIFTHKEWHMHGYVVGLADLEMNEITMKKDGEGNSNGFIFADQNEINELYSIPSAFAAYVPYISKKPYEMDFTD